MEDNNIKRPMSLELNSGKHNNMKPKLNVLPANNYSSLDSTNITTPDIEKLLTMLPTPSINNNLGGNPMYDQQHNPPNEKEEFSMGFVEALHNLHKNENQQQQQQSNQQTTIHSNGMSGKFSIYFHPIWNLYFQRKEGPSHTTTWPRNLSQLRWKRNHQRIPLHPTAPLIWRIKRKSNWKGRGNGTVLQHQSVENASSSESLSLMTGSNVLKGRTQSWVVLLKHSKSKSHNWSRRLLNILKLGVRFQ